MAVSTLLANSFWCITTADVTPEHFEAVRVEFGVDRAPGEKDSYANSALRCFWYPQRIWWREFKLAARHFVIRAEDMHIIWLFICWHLRRGILLFIGILKVWERFRLRNASWYLSFKAARNWTRIPNNKYNIFLTGNDYRRSWNWLRIIRSTHLYWKKVTSNSSVGCKAALSNPCYLMNLGVYMAVSPRYDIQ